jgi:uncharacterized protein (TIGR02246 family)
MTDAEAAVRALIDRWAQAVRDGNMRGVLSDHTDDVVLFDVAPPLQSRGLEAYRRSWEPFLAEGPHAIFELGELEVVVGETVAYAHALLRIEAEKDFAVRLTLGFRKVRGQWQLAHEHHSAPLALLHEPKLHS